MVDWSQTRLIFRPFFEDEYWQGPEVAHAWYYGYGGDGARDHGGQLTWEWEKCIALRGVLHPGSIPKQTETKSTKLYKTPTEFVKKKHERIKQIISFIMIHPNSKCSVFFHFVTLTEK